MIFAASGSLPKLNSAHTISGEALPLPGIENVEIENIIIGKNKQIYSIACINDTSYSCF